MLLLVPHYVRKDLQTVSHSLLVVSLPLIKAEANEDEVLSIAYNCSKIMEAELKADEFHTKP